MCDSPTIKENNLCIQLAAMLVHTVSLNFLYHPQTLIPNALLGPHDIRHAYAKLTHTVSLSQCARCTIVWEHS